jgi:hypothetical protein
MAAELKQENAVVGSLLDVTDAERSSISTVTMDGDSAAGATTEEVPVVPAKRAQEPRTETCRRRSRTSCRT